MATASDVLRIARGEVGYDRYSDPQTGTKYGRWYEQEVDGPGGYDYGANGVAYCAMFASWVLAQAGVKCAGMPGAYCPSIHHSQTLTASQLQPGDLVLFDWDDDGTDDHIGIVVSNDPAAKQIKTIEGNTDGGKVLERTRAYSTICGGIRPAYGGGATEAKGIGRELVEAVANGEYGNGDARAARLAAEGYDAAAVQAAVNAYLRNGTFGAVVPAYAPGTYEVTKSELNVRTLPQTGSASKIKTKAQLTADGQKHANAKGQLLKGTRMDVSRTQLDAAGNTWGLIPSGWVCMEYEGKSRVRRG